MYEQLMAMDRDSVRSYDADNRLHVESSHISKANVCPYRGSEIPNYRQLGLDPDKIYKLLRDPEELRRGAATFNRLPILSKHVPVDAADHRPDLVIGSTGSHAVFDEPYLDNSLTIWVATYIAAIENKVQTELSSAYRYDADMTPGTFKGSAYDGVMRNIRGNHVALVETGRAGADVVVGDAALEPQTKEKDMPATKKTPLSRQAVYAVGALNAFTKPKLAMDQKVNFAPLLKGVTQKNWGTEKGRLKKDIPALLKGKLAMDADISTLVQLLDALGDNSEEIAEVVADPDNPDPVADPDAADPNAPAMGDADAPNTEGTPGKPGDTDGDGDVDSGDDAVATRVTEFLKGKISDEDMQTLMTMMKPQVDPDEAPPAVDAATQGTAPVKKPEMVSKVAMDAALASVAKTVEKSTIARLRGIDTARKAVFPLIGEVNVAMDSADEIYKMALTARDVDLTGVPSAAYGAMVGLLTKTSTASAPKSPMAMDAAAVKDITTRLPHISRLKHR